MTGNKRSLKRLGVFFAVIGILVLLYHCPFRYFFGIACPGCGMTRALLSALRLDLAAAFAYHPLWPFLLPVGMYLALSAYGLRIPYRQQNAYLVFLLLLIAAVYILRLCAGDPVVQPDMAQAVLRTSG